MKRTTIAIAIGAICAGMSGSLLAQENNDTTNGTTDVQVEQDSADVQVQQESPDVTVDQPQPDVTVEQPEPEVTIEQPEPEVTVEQPEPDVTVETAEPDVNVETAEPDVNVEQSGEPDVSVDETGDASVNVDQADDANAEVNQQDNQDSSNDEDNADRNNADSSSDEAIMSQQVSDLEGTAVVNQNDEEIGDVQHIAMHNDSNDLFAIISVGGIWGFGSTEIALPLSDMQYQNDQLVIDTTYGSDQIEESSDEYNEDDYAEVDGDMTVSEARNQ